LIAPEGLLVVDKPAGPTSHDVVAAIRRLVRGSRVGHTGTLDPFATGVLPVCIGRATRLARFITASTKQYDGAIRLGVTTDTYDSTGRVVSERSTEGIGAEEVRRIATRFVGASMQRPPAYSARKHKGRPLHELARAGVEVPRQATPVSIYRLEILSVAGPIVRFEADTSPGTYIRSLAHDLGEALGCGAHLAELRRVASGGLRLADAHCLEEIDARARAGTLDTLVIALRDIDLGLPTVVATDRGREAMRAGRPVPPALLAAGRLPDPAGAGGEPVPVRVLDGAGDLLGVAALSLDDAGGPILRPEVVFLA